MTPTSIALAETILARYPDPDDFPYRRWCYSQGYVLDGFAMLWRSTGEHRYFDYIKRFVDQHVTPDGQVRDFTGESLDDIMAGTAILTVFAETGEENYGRAADQIRDAFRDYPRNADGGFWHSRSLPHEMWIDGVFMGQMFLSRYAAVRLARVTDPASIADQRYCFDEATHQIIDLANHCRKGSSGLFLHAYDEARHAAWADPTTGLSPEVWSEGLGWYALVLVETLAVLPSDHPNRPAVLTILRDLLAGLRGCQDPQTGLWYQIVDKGEQPDNWHDTSGSAMFVYAIQRACDLGLVGQPEYEPVAQRGYRGIVGKATPNTEGLIDIHDACDGVCVQTSYRVYVDYPKQLNAKEAVGSVLWATAIVEKPTSA